MRINFKRIEIKNFMAFDEEVFDFTDLNGMTLVQGFNHDIPGKKNGAGKSTLWNALLYVLFGQTLVKVKNDHVINRQSNDRSMRLVLWLDVGGTNYKVIRSIVKRTSTLEVFKISNTDEIEEDLTKSSILETQEMIETEILKCDASIFLRTILLTAGETYNFYLLKKADKKEFVEKLFDITVFEDMWKLLHREILDLGKDILSKQNYLLGLSKTVDDYEDQVKSYDVDHQKKLELLSESLKKSESELELERNHEIKTNSSAVKKLESALEKLDEKCAELCRQESALTQKISKCELGVDKLKNSKSSNEKTIAKHSEVLNKLCDDCKDVFKSYYSLDVCLKEITEAENKISKFELAKKQLCDERTKLVEERNENNEKIQKVKTKIRELTAEAQSAKTAIIRLESKVENLRSDLDRVKNEKNPWLDALNDRKKQIKTNTDELDMLGSKHKKLELAESIVSQETLRKFIIKDLIVLLNNKIKTYLTKLGAGFYVVFDEDMEYEFVTPSGSCEWGNFSGGERMQTMVATSFAFRDFMSARNGLNSNLLVLDEYFDGAIDDMTVERVLDLLKEMSKEFNQNIYVITHRKEVTPDMFDHLMTVEKKDGISHISVN